MDKINLSKESINLESLKIAEAEMIAHSPEELKKVMDAMYANVFHMMVKLQQDYDAKLSFIVEQVNAHLESEITKANKENKTATASVLNEIQDKIKTLKIDVK